MRCGPVVTQLSVVIGLSCVGLPVLSHETSPVTLHVFGPELPFMFKTSEMPQDFSWAEIVSWGDAAVGTIEKGHGEVIGFDNEFYVADPDNRTPRPVTKEMTPTGVVVKFVPEQSFDIGSITDLGEFQDALDATFVDTETFIYVFRARATFRQIEYQLEGPGQSSEMRSLIAVGQSQRAMTVGSTRYTVKDVPATLIGIRAPQYLNTVFEIPYHIHFLADDKTSLGHIVDLEASDVAVEWVRTDALDLRYWDKK